MAVNSTGTIESYHKSTNFKFIDFKVSQVRLGTEKHWIPNLLNHQIKSKKFLADRDRVFDQSDAGTGKTPVHITDAAARRRAGGGKILVFCPKSLIKSAWGDDIEVFAPDMKVSLAYADNRIEAFEEDADFYITNIDAALFVATKKPRFFDEFEVLIIDESTSVKHHTSKRSKAIAKIKQYFPVRRLLTGTPMPNGVCDVHNQMFIVDDGKLLGESFFNFRKHCCTPEQVGKSAKAIQWTDKPNIETLVGALIEPVVIRHRFEECVDIPPNVRIPMFFDMNKRQRERYNKLEADKWLNLKKAGKSVTAVNGAVLYSKLLQCASGAVYDDSGEYELLDAERNELICDLIEARKHSIVFFNWKHQRDGLIHEFKAKGWPYAVIDGDVTKKGERERIVSAYQNGDYKVLLAHPQSAGHGLTLTRGTTTIFASPTANLEHFLQAYKRIYRIGQREKTETIMILARGTIDESVWASCQDKDAKQFNFLEYFNG